MIHSFRESNSDPHPDIKSKATKEALMKYKQIKDEISSGTHIYIIGIIIKMKMI